jgi:hypothetical protein
VHVEERCFGAAFVHRIQKLSRCISGASKCGAELGVNRLDPYRRGEPVCALARRVQPVLKPAQELEGVLVVELNGITGQLLELEERPCKPTPKRADLRRVPLPDAPNRSHR